MQATLPRASGAGRDSAALRSGFARPGHAVAAPPLGVDVRGVIRVVAQFLAQPLDDSAHHLCVAGVALVPDLAQQRVVGRDAPRVEREGPQQFLLGRREFDLAPRHAHPAPVVVDREVAALEGGGVGAAAQRCVRL